MVALTAYPSEALQKKYSLQKELEIVLSKQLPFYSDYKFNILA